MNQYEIICLIDNPNDKTIKYSTSNNSISQINSNKSYKFNRLIIEENKYDFYYEEIIQCMKYNYLHNKNKKFNYIFIIYGNAFDNSYSFYNLINDIIDDFIMQTYTFSINGLILDINSATDILSNKIIDFDFELNNDFKSTEQIFDPSDPNIFDEIDRVMNNVNININHNKMLSHYIFTLNNYNQKITLINLSDLVNVSDNYINSYNKDKFFINSEVTSLNIFLLDFKSNFKEASNNSKLTQIIKKMMVNDTICRTIFSYVPNDKLLRLSEFFYDYYSDKNKQKPIIFNKNNELVIKVPKYEPSPQILKIKPEKITEFFKPIIPSPTDKLNKESSELINYSKNNQIIPFGNLNKKSNIKPNKSRQKMNSNLLKRPLKEKIYKEPKKSEPFELIKYIPEKYDSEILYEKTCIFNKFLFEKCVKNQLKLQEAYRNKDLIESNSKEVLIQMKAMLCVLLDQINEMDL